MDKYEEAKDIVSIFKGTFNHHHWNEIIQMPLTLLTHFKVWYDERQRKKMCAECEYHDKCDTLNAFNPGCLGFVDKQRAKETCEKWECPYLHNIKVCPEYGRRIVEKEREK